MLRRCYRDPTLGVRVSQRENLTTLLRRIVECTEEDIVPPGATYYVLSNFGLQRLLENRCQGFNIVDRNYLESPWRLPFWKGSDGCIHPTVIAYTTVEHTSGGSRTRFCWIQLGRPDGDRHPRLINPCSLFALSSEGNRIHVRPFYPERCPPSCLWLSHPSVFMFKENQYSGADLQSARRRLEWLDWLRQQDPANDGIGYRHITDQERNVWVNATPVTRDRERSHHTVAEIKTHLHKNLREGLQDVRLYIAGGYDCQEFRHGKWKVTREEKV